RLGQGTDAERLDRDKIPFLRSHIVDRRALLDGVELAVEPGDFDVEQLAPPFGRLLALRAPGGLQACIGERRLQWFLRTSHLRSQSWADAQPAEQRGRGTCGRRRLKKIA